MVLIRVYGVDSDCVGLELLQEGNISLASSRIREGIVVVIPDTTSRSVAGCLFFSNVRV
jgi:hypothetical protein